MSADRCALLLHPRCSVKFRAMFKKILIANRGEIACRVMRTAARMGIGTVAVYSDADRDALHVAMADEAVEIGPAPVAESYLVVEKIVQACIGTGADAVHPGYGFLAENPAFAEALAAHGIAFIGPGVTAIRVMGDKIESKKLARSVGVNTIPGHLGVVADADEAARIAAAIGYPVMLKASAGGGGKGMRLIADAADLGEGLRAAASEARTAFGDDRVFVEKFIAEPRHIEIQVLADGEGRCIHLGERECSIQRRHQKVIEEAPSPFLDDETRRAMGAQAVALARAVDYCSAGTVEFIVDGERNFYFLEMNTRLQVEHPVTELVTGIDLVEQMIRIAAGEPLTIDQDDVPRNGWAIESRIYAEDPYRGFVPSAGRLRRFRPPPTSDSVRVDTGVVEGSEIALFYDPMIAKLCTHGADRAEAVDRMIDALDGFVVRGIAHNVNFLAAVCDHPRYRAGRLTTGFIDQEYPDGFAGAEPAPETYRALLAVAVALQRRIETRDYGISGRVANTAPADRTAWVAVAGDDRVDVMVTDGGDDFEVEIDGHRLPVRGDWRPGDILFAGSVGGRAMRVQVDPLKDGLRLTHGGTVLDVAVRRPRVAELAALMPKKPPADMSKFLRCPMPGLVVSVDVVVGQAFEAGHPLAVVEAMKMENVLRAAADGVVAEILVEPGASLAVDDVIMAFE